MESHPLPYSFNEVYLDELKKLRKNAFEGTIAPEPFVEVAKAEAAQKAESAQEAEAAREKNKQDRAANLVEIYANVHCRLTDADADRKPLAALCLSGGGIRSATFNLGVLQGLARIGLLSRFDYLSSVSGGGYIAGWLKAWMCRAGTEQVIRELANVNERQCEIRGNGGKPAASPTSSTPVRDPLAPEPEPLDRLREYSNYLTPKVGLFSADTWTAVALVVRNLILNWLVLVPLLAAIVALPQVMLLAVRAQPSPDATKTAVRAALIAAFIASFAVHWLRKPRGDGRRSSQRAIIFGVVVPVYLAAVLLTLGIAWAPWQWSVATFFTDDARAGWLIDVSTFVAIWSVVIPVAGWLLTELIRGLRWFKSASHRGRGRGWEFFALVLSGIDTGALLVLLAYYAICGEPCGRTGPYLLDRPILFVILVLPTLLAAYLLARALFVAIAGLGEERLSQAPRAAGDNGQVAASLDDFDREWWARLSGWVIALAVGWLFFSALCLVGGYLLERYAGDYAREMIAAAGGLAGVVTAVLARSGKTSSGRGTTTVSESKWKDISLKMAAPVFILALLALLSNGTAALGRKVTGEDQLLDWIRRSKAPAAQADTANPGLLDAFKVDTTTGVSPRTFTQFTIWVPGLLMVVALGVARVVNVNRFSMHGLYRNRLVRAYLGASNTGRNPDPFTGFATDDNPSLSSIWREGPSDKGAVTSTRPLPVINATLNLVAGGRRLAWQLRKAESFSMTPFYCGNFHEGYRETAKYGGRGGVSLGTAITISGAAANPNMGYHSSPAVTFLMTMLNARLGAWLGNTNEHGALVFDRPGPKYALKPLVAELLGLTDSEHRYINLSDGGHFDNLGLYEMVLRRCRYILVSDAGRDPSAGFEDLGNAIRKIRIDFGIPIEFRRKIEIFPREERDASLFCATADILYSEADGVNAPNGQLIYIKPALFGRGDPIPYDVLAYSRASDNFPHESTNDQWFDEAQFESYRALGRHIISQINVGRAPVSDFPQFLKAVDQYIGAAGPVQP